MDLMVWFRKIFLRYSVAVALAVGVLLLAGGCASVTPVAAPQPLGESESDGPERSKGWWYARFQMYWPEDAEPAWHLDAILAHRVVRPVLRQYRAGIDLWRFHRRAGRDSSGHQFSFIFYANPATADRIYRAVRSNPDLADMKSSGMIVRDNYDDTRLTERPGIDDTSDKSWSEPVRKAWPYFIMGVSETWLDLISQFAAKQFKGNAPSSVDDLDESYRQVHQAVEEAWRKEGCHAFLHHLNAVFGYEPLVINIRHLMRF